MWSTRQVPGPLMITPPAKRRYVAHPNTIFEISHNIYPAERFSMHSIIRQRA